MGSSPGTEYWLDVSNASYYINIQENNENTASQKYFKKLIYKKTNTKKPLVSAKKL